MFLQFGPVIKHGHRLNHFCFGTLIKHSRNTHLLAPKKVCAFSRSTKMDNKSNFSRARDSDNSQPGGSRKTEHTSDSSRFGEESRSPPPVTIRYTFLGPEAKAPVQATRGAAGYDLYSTKTERIKADMGFWKFDTQLAVEIPDGYYGRIAGRSGLALNKNIVAFPGVIDSDYRGTVSVLLAIIGCNGDETHVIEKHTRIAQLLILPLVVTKCYFRPQLNETDRGKGGFGSTGDRTLISPKRRLPRENRLYWMPDELCSQ